MLERIAARRALKWAPLGLTGAIFVVDLFTPQGVTESMLYLVPMVLATWTASVLAPFPLAVLCTGLTVVGLFFSPAGVPTFISIANRALAVSTFWAVSALLRQRVVAEIALRVSEERHRMFAAMTTDFVYVYRLEPDGRLVNEWTSESIYRLLGYGPETLLTLAGAFDVIHADDRPEVERGFSRVLAGESVDFELRVVTAQGDVRWLQNWVQPRWNADRTRVIGLYGAAQDITLHKRAQEALRESERKFSVIFEKAPFAAVLAEAQNGRIVEVNEAFELVFGYGREEAKGRTSIDLGLQTREAREQKRSIFRAHGTIRNFEETLSTKSGDRRVMLLNTDHVEIAGRTHVLATAHDITDQKSAEGALRESEARLRLFIDHAPAALAMFDREMRYLAASHRWMTDYGLSESSIIGRSHYEVFHEIPDHWKAAHRRGLAGEILRADEDRFERRDGTEQWLRWEVRPWLAADGSVGGIVIFTEDVTERRRAETALRESEERLRLALDAAHMGTFDWDVSSDRITSSRWHEELWGFQPGEFAGTYASFSERVHSNDLAGVNAEVGRCMSSREPFAREFRVVWPDGSIHWVQVRGEFSFDPAGQPVRMRGVVVETTDRKRAEETLREVSHLLLAAEDEERRRIAKELHDSTAQDLVAVMMILDASRDSVSRRAGGNVHQIDDAIAILEKSAHDLRTLSYLLHPPRLEEAGLVGAIPYYVAGFAERTGIRVTFALPETLRRPSADVELVLFRSLQEALSNVYRHAGSPTATVSLTSARAELRLEIQDAGCGIPHGVLDSAHRSGPGLGVGIPSMRERLQQVGGRLEIESSARGTTVRAVVPGGTA